MVTCPSEPHDANTPPVVGWRRYTRYGRCARLCSSTAAAILTICRNATVPSCIRVPPELGEANRGSRSAVARSTAAVIRSAAAIPIDPARKSNSDAITATRRPWTRPSPVTTDSSSPVASRAAASSRAYPGPAATASGVVSQLANDPGSSTASRSSDARIRLTAQGYPPSRPRCFTVMPVNVPLGKPGSPVGSGAITVSSATAIGVGGMMGAGLYTLVGLAATMAGPLVPVAFAVGGLVAVFSVYSYAELGARYPSRGGAAQVSDPLLRRRRDLRWAERLSVPRLDHRHGAVRGGLRRLRSRAAAVAHPGMVGQGDRDRDHRRGGRRGPDRHQARRTRRNRDHRGRTRDSCGVRRAGPVEVRPGPPARGRRAGLALACCSRRVCCLSPTKGSVW